MSIFWGNIRYSQKNVTPTSSPQKLPKASNDLPLTYEQIRIVQHPIQQNDVINF